MTRAELHNKTFGKEIVCIHNKWVGDKCSECDEMTKNLKIENIK